MSEETDKDITSQNTPDFDPDFDLDLSKAPQWERMSEGRFKIGDLIMARYRVLAELGQGGMGVVYKCFDETAGIEIALKALPPELSHNTLEMEDIKDDFQLVHNLHHPNIASSNTLERNPENGNYYLIMECCEGEDLRRWLKRKRRDDSLTLDDVFFIVEQVADALDYAHKQKVMHRDIKLANIMIDSEGTIKVLDFGLAAQIHTSMTRVSMAYRGTSGTGPYMAPEQWRGKKQSPASDQYALAVMTYEMLSGDLPFESSDPAVLKQAVLDETPDEIPDVPPAVQNALNRAMSKEPAQRFNSCGEFYTAMNGGDVVSPEPVIAAAPALEKPKAATKDPLVIRAKLFLESGNFKKAEEYCERSLDQNPENGEAYFIRLMAEQQSSDPMELAQIESLTKNPTWIFAQRFGDQALQKTMEAILKEVSRKEEEARITEEKCITEEARMAEEERNAAQWTFDLNGVELKMIRVKAGTFNMGSDNGNNDEKPVHQVTLTKDFFLGQYEVTQAQWKAVMGNNPSHFKGANTKIQNIITLFTGNNPSLFKDANRPVECVSWYDTMEFCQELNDSGKAPEGWKFTLPTEAQWEYAARGGNKSRGYKYSGSDKIDDVAWYAENADEKTHAVDTKKPNELGIYDMSGNVWEWCLDWYDDGRNYYSESAVTDPQGPENGSYRVLRGGSWSSVANYCRAANRLSDNPDNRYISGGFRVALVPKQ